MTRIENLINFIKNNELEKKQTFFTRNIVGDYMENIYNEDGIIVDICRGWDYLEIFGLTTKEKENLRTILDCYF